MRIDIIETKPKNSNIKIIMIAIFVIIFIAFFSVLGMKYARLYKLKRILSRKQNQIQNYMPKNEISNKIVEAEIKEENTMPSIEDREIVKKVFMPVYSEKAKKEMKNIYNPNYKIAYLTFDDGPSRAVTPLILDLLKKQNIKATFFVLGSSVKANPDIVKRAYLEGHYIANHGYSHNYSKLYSSSDNVLEEYNKTEDLIRKAIENPEYSSHLFRFPGGFEGGKYAKMKKTAGNVLNNNDISYIDWNVLTGDAEGANTKEKIIENVKKYMKDKGNIVLLMHDASTKILTYETLQDVINCLRDEGYTFENFYKIMS